MKRLTFAALAALAFLAAPPAHAAPAGNAICRLLAAGNTPEGLENSVTVHQVLGPDASNADARVYIRSVVAGQCPQYLWRF
jgi:outer membrane protein W